MGEIIWVGIELKFMRNLRFLPCAVLRFFTLFYVIFHDKFWYVG